jgi:hypothetical protein
VRERQAAIELVHARFEDAHHREAFHARRETGGRGTALGRHDHDFLSHLHIQLARQRTAQDDAEAAGREIRERAFLHAR